MRAQAAFGLCAALFLSVGGAAADEGAFIAIMAPLHSTEGANEMEELATAARYQLADLELSARLVWVDALPAEEEAQKSLARETAAQSGATAVVWLSPGEGTWRFHLLMASDGTDWIVTRDVAIAEPVALAETLAAIARASVTAVMSARNRECEPATEVSATPLAEEAVKASADAPTAAPREDTSRKEPPAEPARRVFVPVGVGYRIGATASGAGPSHGLEILLGLRFSPYLGIHASYTVWSAVSEERYGLALEVARHPVAFGLDLERAWGRLRVAFSLAFEIDYVKRDIRAVSTTMAAGESGGYLEAGLEPTLRAAVRLVSELSLYVGGGAELFFNRPSYDVTFARGKEALYSPWLVQPFGCAGLAFEF
jgi:hypothetical protein